MPIKQKRSPGWRLTDSSIKIGDVHKGGLHLVVQQLFKTERPSYRDMVLQEDLFDTDHLEAWLEEATDPVVVEELTLLQQFMNKKKLSYIRVI